MKRKLIAALALCLVAAAGFAAGARQTPDADQQALEKAAAALPAPSPKGNGDDVFAAEELYIAIIGASTGKKGPVQDGLKAAADSVARRRQRYLDTAGRWPAAAYDLAGQINERLAIGHFAAELEAKSGLQSRLETDAQITQYAARAAERLNELQVSQNAEIITLLKELVAKKAAK